MVAEQTRKSKWRKAGLWTCGVGSALVVMVLCAFVGTLIVAIAFPVFSRVRSKATRTKCLSQLHQLSLAMKEYTDDHAGRYPRHQGWEDALVPTYVGRDMLKCPSEKNADVGYALSESLGGRRARDVKSPDTVPVFYDCEPGTQYVAHRHGGAAPAAFAAFADGDVRRVSPGQMIRPTAEPEATEGEDEGAGPDG